MPMRLLRSMIAIAGYFGIAFGAGRQLPAMAQDYRASEAAPAAWMDYAKRVQGLFREWLAADDSVIRDMSVAQEKAGKGSLPKTVTVRAWIASDGKVERIELNGIDGVAAVTLRSKLARGDIGLPPPPGMLQPLNLRLSLGDKS
jgi:hypothetical protein